MASMGLSGLFNGTSCPFNRCILNFANPYDLIAHIEDAHCSSPPINVVDHEQNKFVRPNSIYNLFPGGHKPIPVPKLPTKLNFECYKKRTNSVGSLALSRIRGSESERTDDGEEGEGGDGEERKYKCTVDGCDKRYKNLQGVKYHMRSAHGKPEESATVGGGGSIPGGVLPVGNNFSTLDGSIAATVGQVVSSSTGLGLPPATPTKYAMSRPHKCPHCCKRYKTTTGMNNHMATSHNKLSSSSMGSMDSSSTPSSVTQSVHDILARTAKEVQAAEEMQQQALLENKSVGSVLQSGVGPNRLRTFINQHHHQNQQHLHHESTAGQQQLQPMQQQPPGNPLPPPQSPMGQQPPMSGGGGMQSHPHHMQQPQQHLNNQQQMQQHHQLQQQVYYQQQQQPMHQGGVGGGPQYHPQRTVREEIEASRGAGGGISLPPLNPSPQRRMSRPSMTMQYRDEMVSSSLDSSASTIHGVGGGSHLMTPGPSPHPSHSHPHTSHSSHHGPPTSTVRLLPPAEEMFHQRETVQLDQSHYRGQPPYQSLPTSQYQRPLPPQSAYHHQVSQQQSQDAYPPQPPPQRVQYIQEGEGYAPPPPRPLPSITSSFTSDSTYQYPAPSNQYGPPQGPPSYGNQPPPSTQYGEGYSQQQQPPPHYYGEEKREGRPMDHHDYSR